MVKNHKMNKILGLICITLPFSNPILSQSKSIDFGLSFGNEQAGETVMLHITPCYGYSFKGPDYIYGGLDVGPYSLNPFDEDSY